MVHQLWLPFVRALDQDKEALLVELLCNAERAGETYILEALLRPLSEEKQHHGHSAAAGEARSQLLAVAAVAAACLPDEGHQGLPLEKERRGCMSAGRLR